MRTFPALLFFTVLLGCDSRQRYLAFSCDHINVDLKMRLTETCLLDTQRGTVYRTSWDEAWDPRRTWKRDIAPLSLRERLGVPPPSPTRQPPAATMQLRNELRDKWLRTREAHSATAGLPDHLTAASDSSPSTAKLPPKPREEDYPNDPGGFNKALAEWLSGQLSQASSKVKIREIRPPSTPTPPP